MPFLQNLKSLIQLPGQLRRTTQSQTQAELLRRRLAGQPTPQQQIAQTQQAIQPFPASPVAQPATAPTLPPQQNVVLPQLEAIRKQVEDIQGGLRAIPVPEPPPAPVISPAEDRLRGIEEALLKAQETTPEEAEAERQLTELAGQFRLGKTAIQEKPIPMPFITGQQAALERRAAALSEPLSRRLAVLQGKRAAAIDVARERFSIEEKRLKEETRMRERREDITREARKRRAPLEISAGATLFDPETGRPIFQAPARPSTEAELARLEIARQNAQTARERAELQNQINEIKLQQMLIGGGLTEEQKKGLTKVQGAEDIANQIEDALTELQPEAFGLTARATGLFRGTLAKAGLDPAVRAYEALRQSSIAPLARAISGEVGVLTDRDIARAEQLLPKIGETKEEVQRKLNNLRKAIENRRSAVVNPLGFTQKPSPTQSSEDPLGIR